MYCGRNCVKGEVFLQLCGWMGVENLQVGAMSNSYYHKKTKIFKKQDTFAKAELPDGKHIPFNNILEKVYRVSLPEWRGGKQQVIQPTFIKSNRKLSSRETKNANDIAIMRSGN